MTGRRLYHSVWIAVSVLTAGRAFGGEVPPAKDRGCVVVIIASQESEADSKVAVQAVAAHLADLDVRLEAVWVKSFPAALRDQIAMARQMVRQKKARAVFWADLSTDNQIILYISEPNRGRTLVRELTFESQSEQNRFEVMAIAARTAVSVLIDGGWIGINRGQSFRELTQDDLGETAPDTGSPDSSPERGTGDSDQGLAWAQLGYGVALYDDSPTFQHGGRFALAFGAGSLIRVFAAYRLLMGVQAENAFVKMRLKHHPFELGAAMVHEQGDLAWSWGAAMVNDPVTWSISRKTDAVGLVDDRFRWLAGINLFAAVGWRITDLISLYGAGGADIYFNEKRAAVIFDREDFTVVDPLKARPYFHAGATVELF